MSAARPALAGPRVTLRLGQASLHEVLVRLSEESGYRFAAPGGLGQPGYKDPPGAKRRVVAYENVPLGRVIREIAAAHDFVPRSAGGYILLVPRAGLAAARETAAGSQGELRVSVQRLSQSEYREIVPGSERPREEKSLDLRLLLRVPAGDGDHLGPLQSLKLTEADGRVRVIPATAYNRELGRGLPDERHLDLSLPWTGPHTPQLRRLEGIVEFYPQVGEQRIELRIVTTAGKGREQPLAEAVSAPFTVKLLRLSSGNSITARLRVEWTLHPFRLLNEQGQVRVTAVLADGRRVPLAGEVRPGRGGPAHGIGDFFGSGSGPVTALEVLVPVRGSEVVEVPFALTDVILPFGQSHPLRTRPLNEPLRPLKIVRFQNGPKVPAAFQDAAGGTLRIRARPSQAEEDAEVVMGLCRKLPTGSWGAVHWLSFTGTESWLELAKLAPGTYRIQLRLPGGSAPREGVARANGSRVVVIRREQTTTVAF